MGGWGVVYCAERWELTYTDDDRLLSKREGEHTQRPVLEHERRRARPIGLQVASAEVQAEE